MFNDKKQASTKVASSALSMIGADVLVKGDITAKGDMHIDGVVEGNVHCGSLSLGSAGSIKGDIHSDSARIAGKILGLVDVHELNVEASGTISGDIHYTSLHINEGAQVDGKLSRKQAATANVAILSAATQKAKI